MWPSEERRFSNEFFVCELNVLEIAVELVEYQINLKQKLYCHNDIFFILRMTESSA